VLTLLIKTKVGRVLLLALAAMAAYVAWQQPDWAMVPLRSLASRALVNFGIGLAPVSLWALAFLLLWRYRMRTLFRRWRLVSGTAALLMAVQGSLAYFQGALPLVGHVNLGGAYGLAIQGDTVWLGYTRTAGLVLLGLWVMLPRRSSGSVLLRLAYGLGLMARGPLLLGRLYRRAPVLKPLAWALGAPARLNNARQTRRDDRRADESAAELAGEVSDYLSASERMPPGRPSLDAPNLATAPPNHTPSTDTNQQTHTRPPQPKQQQESPTDEAPPRPRQDNQWSLPPTSLLNPAVTAGAIEDEHTATARLIEKALGQHGVEVQVAEIRPGPTVTMFGLVPGWSQRGKGARTGEDNSRDTTDETGRTSTPTRNRVKVDSILAREKDLALALAAPSLRIEAPVPGESVVGVEVPNRIAATVPIRSVMDSEPYRRLLDQGGLPVALGLASAGEAVAIDLASMPHLLIAGATGSGKSVCLNSVITSLITHQHPSAVRLLLVDPKRVELTPYNGIPHLVTPVVVDPDRVVLLLKGAIQEMLRRYRLLEEAGVRNVQTYNRSAKATETIPYLVICIDELADLMMSSAYDVEQVVCRLAQLGRATGIHLVVATQRPSVDVVTGLIKANFPSRISFAVASQVDSRTILDAVGAERLLGRGDMLFLSPNAAKPRRVQGVFISDQETESLAEHWRRHQGQPIPPIRLEDLASAAAREAIEADSNTLSHNNQDSMFDKALDLATRGRQISTSLLQRRLRIGYPRAARLMDQLEDEGVVAPSSEPGKPRDVISRPAE
jgi:S-DNA-T family DNA segregation ATPase FtsK/SpoIIIE